MNNLVPFVDHDSIGRADEDRRRHSPALLLNPDADPDCLADAALTRISRVESVLRTLERRDDDLTDTVTHGHLASMLNEVTELVNALADRKGTQS